MSPAGNIPVTDVGALKNELRKYKHGKKLDISQFNQAARLAWLGRIALSPLDPEDRLIPVQIAQRPAFVAAD